MPLSPILMMAFYNPYWDFTNANLWFTEDSLNSLTGISAGITFVDAEHPLNNSQEEQILRVDGNAGATLTLAKGEYIDGSQTIITPPATRRWATHDSLIVRFRSTKNLPTSDARLFGSSALGGRSAGAWALLLTTAGTLKLQEWTGALETDHTDFTSSLAVAFDNSWTQIDVWHVLCTSAGVPLTTIQCVVRVISNLTTTQDTVTWINVSFGLPQFDLRFLGRVIGEVATHGAGFEFDACNYYSALEDADDPYGVIRGDMLYPNGGGILFEWTDQAATDLDEMGDATLGNRFPDQATTQDTVTVPLNGTKRNTYDLTAPTYVTGSDAIAGVSMAIRSAMTAAVKEDGFSTGRVLQTDGTNIANVGTSWGGPGITAWKTYVRHAVTAADGTGWDTTDLANLELGMSAAGSSGLGPAAALSTVQALIAFQANGEDTPAVPAAGGRRRGGVF